MHERRAVAHGAGELDAPAVAVALAPVCCPATSTALTTADSCRTIVALCGSAQIVVLETVSRVLYDLGAMQKRELCGRLNREDSTPQSQAAVAQRLCKSHVVQLKRTAKDGRLRVPSCPLAPECLPRVFCRKRAGRTFQRVGRVRWASRPDH